MNNSRRAFMKTLILGAGAIMVAPVLKIRDVLAAGLANAKDPTVMALGYVANVDGVSKALKGKDAAAKAQAEADVKNLKDRKDKKAYCSKCQFYGDATGKAPQSKCQLITSGDVMATGWCRSFSKRA